VTYSIVARDPQTGAFGVAVQSHYFSAGSGVPWAESGIGAVATQAFADISYGPKGLDLMRAGKSAAEALAILVAEDAQSARRQVAMVDANGDAAAHTGAQCIAHAGHRTAPGVSVQANMMERDTVPDAMLAAYASSKGDLADRLLDALDAAEGEGGDIRGRQAAGILVVSGRPSGQWWADRRIDLRVEDHAEPLVELRRLVQLGRAYVIADQAEYAATQGDMATASAKMAEALRLAPDSAEIAFWAAIGAAAAGQIDAAKELLKRASAQEPRWVELVRRLPPTGMFGLDGDTVRALTLD
jgi:uncharacterized Ntn-hydrolase superfamily protein